MELTKENIYAIHSMVLSALVHAKRDMGESQENIEVFQDNITEFTSFVGNFISDERFNGEKIQQKISALIKLADKLTCDYSEEVN